MINRTTITTYSDYDNETFFGLTLPMAAMPPMSHEEAMQWLLDRPEVRAWIWQSLTRMGLISFDPVAGKWVGSKQWPSTKPVLKDERIEALRAAVGGGKSYGEFIDSLQDVIKRSRSTAANVIKNGLKTGIITRTGKKYSWTNQA